jgi:hypothetical protein
VDRPAGGSIQNDSGLTQGGGKVCSIRHQAFDPPEILQAPAKGGRAFTADASGFFILSQLGERPLR